MLVILSPLTISVSAKTCEYKRLNSAIFIYYKFNIKSLGRRKIMMSMFIASEVSAALRAAERAPSYIEKINSMLTHSILIFGKNGTDEKCLIFMPRIDI